MSERRRLEALCSPAFWCGHKPSVCWPLGDSGKGAQVEHECGLAYMEVEGETPEEAVKNWNALQARATPAPQPAHSHMPGEDSHPYCEACLAEARRASGGAKEG